MIIRSKDLELENTGRCNIIFQTDNLGHSIISGLGREKISKITEIVNDALTRVSKELE